MVGRYEHLGLSRWPFPIVPQPDFCTFLADRKQLRQDVDDLLQQLSRRETSSIHLFWAWFGAGKTHTLFYLANRAASLTGGEGNALHCIYSEFPKAAKGFLDLYRSLAATLDIDMLGEAYLEVCTAPDAAGLVRKIRQLSPDLASVLHVLVTGTTADQATTVRWLRADSIPVAQCRGVGASSRIATAEDACRTLSCIQHVLAAATKCKRQPGYRLIWVLDEYQRIEGLPKRVREEMNTSLHSLFNSCPCGLSLLLSFSGKPEPGHIPPWLTKELASRIGRTKVMVLPPLQPREAVAFVGEVLQEFRLDVGTTRDRFFPFTREACDFIIREVATSGQLKPREIMSAFSAVLQEAEPRLERREIKEISPSVAKSILSSYVNVAESMEES